jgi:hypothetical protein
VWLSILIFASLCSPFLPQAYAAFPPLWLLTLLVATYVPTRTVLVALLLAWLGLGIFWPMDWPMDRRLLALLMLLPQSLTAIVAVLGSKRRLTAPSPAAPTGS